MDFQRVELDAGFVYAESDGETATAGFADEQYNTRAYVLLRRALRPSDDDVGRGWDGVHIEVNDQTRSAYGGVQRITLSDKRVLIEVSGATAGSLCTSETIRIDLKNAHVNARQLAETLTLVCGDYAKFHRET